MKYIVSVHLEGLACAEVEAASEEEAEEKVRSYQFNDDKYWDIDIQGLDFETASAQPMDVK